MVEKFSHNDGQDPSSNTFIKNSNAIEIKSQALRGIRTKTQNNEMHFEKEKLF